MSQPLREEIPETITNEQPAPDMPLRWHSFLIKCLLWLAPAAHIFQAVWIFSGRIYYTAEIRAQIYAGIPAMRIIDAALALCLLAAACMQIIARFRLKKLEWSGARLLAGAYALLAACQLIYALARFIFAGLSPLNIPVIAQTLAYAALIWMNKTYYDRRKCLLK